MDREKQQAIRTLQRSGLTLKELLEFVPDYRHVEIPQGWGATVAVFQLEETKRYRDYFNKLPKLKLDPEWEVQLRPPITGAIVRMLVWWGEASVSVYFDADGRLGAQTDYWEIHPSENGDCERFYMEDADGLVDGIRRSLEAQAADQD